MSAFAAASPPQHSVAVTVLSMMLIIFSISPSPSFAEGDGLGKHVGRIELFWRERDVGIRLAASRLANLEYVRNDPGISDSTTAHNRTALMRVRGGNSRLQAEVGRLLSKIAWTQTLREETDSSSPRLAASSGEVHRLHGFFPFMCNYITDAFLPSNG